MYFTDEVKLSAQGEHKFVNEFLVCNNIGRGSYSKVKRVIRLEHGTETMAKLQSYHAALEKAQSQAEIDPLKTIFDPEEVAEFAMKMMHKPTLRRERAIRYDEAGQMQMINNLDKVYSEIEIWTQLNHPYIAKLYEMIDDDSHDYLYLILELADMGQIAVWDFKQECYQRNETVFSFVKDYLESNLGVQLSEHRKDYSVVEQVAQYLFRQIAAALAYLHDHVKVIHRDIKPDNILFNSQTCEIKLTDFTVSREKISDGSRLFDSEGTPCFTAPECHIVAPEGYSPKPTDIWSFGVCLYLFVNDGKLPFYGQSELEIQINSRQNELVIPEGFSLQLKDLISKVLCKEP